MSPGGTPSLQLSLLAHVLHKTADGGNIDEESIRSLTQGSIRVLFEISQQSFVPFVGAAPAFLLLAGGGKRKTAKNYAHRIPRDIKIRCWQAGVGAKLNNSLNTGTPLLYYVLHLFASFCIMQKMALRQAIRYLRGIHEAAIHVPHRTCHLPELTRYPILLTRYLNHYTSIYKIKNKLSELTRYPILLTRYLNHYTSIYKIKNKLSELTRNPILLTRAL